MVINHTNLEKTIENDNSALTFKEIHNIIKETKKDVDFDEYITSLNYRVNKIHNKIDKTEMISSENNAVYPNKKILTSYQMLSLHYYLKYDLSLDKEQFEEISSKIFGKDSMFSIY
jgi:lipid II:glycine glycyltransferase (peptidoglycan interpeptide bridge formation enzyme)